MTNQEILTKAIEKAVANGWSNPYKSYLNSQGTASVYILHDPLYGLIFSHEFAKSLWGDGYEDWTCYKQGQWQDCTASQINMSDSAFTYPKWQYHLMQMVIADDPIKYLEEVL